MTPRPVLRRRHRAAALALLTLTLVPGLAQLPRSAPAQRPRTRARVAARSGLADPVAGLGDLDVRSSAVATAAQRSAATDLGAVDLRWNRFGTPSSILPGRRRPRPGHLRRPGPGGPRVAAPATPSSG